MAVWLSMEAESRIGEWWLEIFTSCCHGARSRRDKDLYTSTEWLSSHLNTNIYRLIKFTKAQTHRIICWLYVYQVPQDLKDLNETYKSEIVGPVSMDVCLSYRYISCGFSVPSVHTHTHTQNIYNPNLQASECDFTWKHIFVDMMVLWITLDDIILEYFRRPVSKDKHSYMRERGRGDTERAGHMKMKAEARDLYQP